MSALAGGLMWLAPWLIVLSLFVLTDRQARARRRARRSRKAEQRALDRAWK